MKEKVMEILMTVKSKGSEIESFDFGPVVQLWKDKKIGVFS